MQMKITIKNVYFINCLVYTKRLFFQNTLIMFDEEIKQW